MSHLIQQQDEAARTQSELDRVLSILSTRNQQLHIAEQKSALHITEANQARRNTHRVMVLCCLFILAWTLGGVA